MAAESQDLVNFTLTKAQFEQLPADTRAFLNATKPASRSAGRRGAAIANQGPHQQAEEQVQEQLRKLLASFPQEKLSQLLTPFLAQPERQLQAKQDGSQFSDEPRDVDSEVNQLKDKVAQLERQLQTKKQDEEDERMRRLLAEKAKEQDEKDERMRSLLAETDEKNKRLQAEVERLKNEAEKNAKLAEQQKRPGVPSSNPAAEPPALALVSLPAPTRDWQAVPATDDSVQAVPDSNAGGNPSDDHDEAGAGPLPVSTAPSTANSGSAGSSGSPSSPASASGRSPFSNGQPLADTHAANVDPEESPEIDMPDTDSPSSSSGAQPPSGSPSSPASASSRSPLSDGQPLADTHAASVDPEESPEIDMPDADSPSSNSGAQPPSGSPKAPSKPRELIDLDTLPPKPLIPIPNPPKYDQGPHKARLNGLIKWGEQNFQQLNVSEFNSGNFIGVWAFDTLFPQSSYPTFVYDGSKELEIPWLEKAFKKAKDKCFLTILCHVRHSDQQSKTKLDHFVVAIVDWRQGKPGTFTHWGMNKNLAEELREASRGGLARLLGQSGGWPSLENISHELDYDDNTCLLGCMTAVRSFLGEKNNIPLEKDGPFALRYFYLYQILEAKSAETRAADQLPQSISHHEGRATAGIMAAAPSDSEGQHGDEVTTQRSSAKRFTSATFRPTKKQLPNRRTRSQVDAAPQVQPTSVPPPPSGQSNNNPVTFHQGVKYQWKPCEGGKIVMLEPSSHQYSDLKKGPEDRMPLLLTVAEELGARDRGAVIIKIPEECRPVLPPQPARTKRCTTYRPMPVKDDFWQLFTVYKTQTLPSLDGGPSGVGSSLNVAIGEHGRRISEASEENSESIEGVAYLTDIPAHSAEERKDALLPPESPIWHIRDNKLPREGVPGRPCVPGLHTPTAYRGTKSAPFAWHFEDLKLGAINVLYIGRKVWFVTEPASSDKATVVFSKALEVKADHDQFLRHQALHGGIEHLRNNGVSTIGFMQEPWEMVIVYPGAYHSGFSVTDTLAEAVNYADRLYTCPKGYKPCNGRCKKDEKPITCELVFPLEAVGKETSSALRRSSRQAPTLRTATTKDSTGSPWSPRKRRRSAGGGSARHEQAEPQDKPQNNSASERVLRKQDDVPDEPQAKRKKPDSQALATEITSPRAKEQFRRHVLALIDHSALKLPNNDSNRPEQSHGYLHLGWRWDDHAPFSKLVGLILTTRGLEMMYEAVLDKNALEPHGIPGIIKLPRLPPQVINDAKTKSGFQGDGKLFTNRLQKLRMVLKLGWEYLPFMPVGSRSDDSSAVTYRDFEQLSDEEIRDVRKKLTSSAQGKIIAKAGRAFRNSILKGDWSVWTGLGDEAIKQMAVDKLLDVGDWEEKLG